MLRIYEIEMSIIDENKKKELVEEFNSLGCSINPFAYDDPYGTMEWIINKSKDMDKE